MVFSRSVRSKWVMIVHRVTEQAPKKDCQSVYGQEHNH